MSKLPLTYTQHLKYLCSLLDNGVSRYEKRDEDGRLIGFIYYSKKDGEVRIHEVSCVSLNPFTYISMLKVVTKGCKKVSGTVCETNYKVFEVISKIAKKVSENQGVHTFEFLGGK
jgi:hypothetical protein